MAGEKPPEAIEVFYQKSNFFRVVHADGCVGGPSPRGLINCSFYSERSPLPKRTSLAVVDGRPGAETMVEIKSGVFREVEVNVVMDLPTAAAFSAWIQERINFVRELSGVTEEQLAQMIGKKG